MGMARLYAESVKPAKCTARISHLERSMPSAWNSGLPELPTLVSHVWEDASCTQPFRTCKCNNHWRPHNRSTNVTSRQQFKESTVHRGYSPGQRRYLRPHCITCNSLVTHRTGSTHIQVTDILVGGTGICGFDRIAYGVQVFEDKGAARACTNGG